MRGGAAAAPIAGNQLAEEIFAAKAQALGLDPGSAWVGGYVDYEWKMLRPIFQGYGLDLRGLEVLEFGCNYGASSIVMARLGASVCGVDVDPSAVDLARSNAARYGRADIALQHVPDTRHLPYGDGRFDFVLCNSVLEYVRPAELAAVLRELRRVLKPGGRMLITGTSSRLALREVHSGRWLVNYLPRRVDSWLGRSWQRGLSPFLLHRLVRDGFSDEDGATRGRGWAAARAAMRGGGRPPARVRAVAALGRWLGIGPGWLTPNISVMLRRAR
jgi:SAM-dependent methyltransferase